MPSQWTPYSLSCCAESRKGNIVKNAEQMDKLVVEKMGADELMEVDSAFMMLAIYKISAVIGARYKGVFDGRADCEHIAFHRDMKEIHNARIVMTNWVYCQGDPGWIPPTPAPPGCTSLHPCLPVWPP
jgi:hypothetical protein